MRQFLIYENNVYEVSHSEFNINKGNIGYMKNEIEISFCKESDTIEFPKIFYMYRHKKYNMTLYKWNDQITNMFGIFIKSYSIDENKLILNFDYFISKLDDNKSFMIYNNMVNKFERNRKLIELGI